MSLKLSMRLNWPEPQPSACGEWLELSSAPISLSEKVAGEDSYVVNYPVSITYNGGIVYDGEWYKGFRVPPPEVPEGYELVSMAVSYQLNSRPPYATMLLRRKK